MMAEVVLDANIIVATLYEGDVHHARAKELRAELRRDGHEIVMLDFLVQEAVSVLCRRAKERKTNPPDLPTAIAAVRKWFESGGVRFVGSESERLVNEVLDMILATGGVLNFNDALVVVLKREGAIDRFATFDPGFDSVPDFERLS